MALVLVGFVKYTSPFYNIPDLGLVSAEDDRNWLTYTDDPGAPWVMELAQRYVKEGVYPRK